MKTFRTTLSKIRAAATVLGGLAIALALFSCATVNRLGEFDAQGHSLGAQMRIPPQPDMDVHYNLKLDFSNLVGTAINVGSTIAESANAQRVETLMREALDFVDVPGIVREEAWSTCLTVLDAQREEDPGSAEYLLDFDIHKYGIHAGSWTSAVTLRVKLTVSLYHTGENAVVWRRNIDVERPATPSMFGLDATLGNVVTTLALASLEEPALENGFDALARDTALTVARTLQSDLYDARFPN